MYSIDGVQWSNPDRFVTVTPGIRSLFATSRESAFQLIEVRVRPGPQIETTSSVVGHDVRSPSAADDLPD